MDAVRAHASFLVARGVERLVPGGNTGEFSSLTRDEVITVTRATREAARDAVVVTGVGGALPDALELTAEALAAGADGVMVHHPAHTHVSERGLEEYYRRIAVAAGGFHQLGAHGYTSGLVNAAPELAVSMASALRKGDIARAMELRELARAFEELRAEDESAKNVPAVRSAMTLAGFPPGPPRPPLAPLDEADERRVAAIWSAWSARGVAGVGEGD